METIPVITCIVSPELNEGGVVNSAHVQAFSQMRTLELDEMKALKEALPHRTYIWDFSYKWILLRLRKDSMPTEALPKRTVYTDPFPWEFFLGTIVS